MSFRKLLRLIELLAINVCVCLLAAHAQQLHRVSFPEQSRAVSPNGRYAIVGVDSDKEPNHTVFLDDLQQKTRRKLFNYDRHIELLWNSDSKSFAVSDYAGSDYSRCSIVSVTENVPPVQVWDELIKSVNAEERNMLLHNDHVYIAATEWISSTILRVKVWGHGDVNPSGFTRFYRYEIRRGFKHE